MNSYGAAPAFGAADALEAKGEMFSGRSSV